MTEKEKCLFSEERIGDKFPIAMAYVRWQELGKMYQPELGLVRGTLFPDLDKPFMGNTVNGGCKR